MSTPSPSYEPSADDEGIVQTSGRSGLVSREAAGGIVWLLVVQYFVMLIVVQAAWSAPYSIIQHAISDLGAVGCGPFEGRYVCSPWHVAANVSWSVTGVSIALGALLLWRVFARDSLGRVGLALLVVAGVGEFLVGLNPEDVSVWHVPAAIVTIVGGLAGILVLGLSARHQSEWRSLGLLGIAFGVLGLVAVAALIATGLSPWFGLIERIAAYPILIWVTVSGATVFVRALNSRPRRHF